MSSSNSTTAHPDTKKKSSRNSSTNKKLLQERNKPDIPRSASLLSGPSMIGNTTITTTTEVITDIGPNDILLGRGSVALANVGNARFRELVQTRKDEYVTTSRRRKKDEISKQIAAIIAQRGGRFLHKIEDQKQAKALGVPSNQLDNAWIEASMPTILTKIKQSLRDLDRDRHDDDEEEEAYYNTKFASAVNSNKFASITTKRRSVSSYGSQEKVEESFPNKKPRAAAPSSLLHGNTITPTQSIGNINTTDLLGFLPRTTNVHSGIVTRDNNNNGSRLGHVVDNVSSSSAVGISAIATLTDTNNHDVAIAAARDNNNSGAAGVGLSSQIAIMLRQQIQQEKEALLVQMLLRKQQEQQHSMLLAQQHRDVSTINDARLLELQLLMHQRQEQGEKNLRFL